MTITLYDLLKDRLLKEKKHPEGKCDCCAWHESECFCGKFPSDSTLGYNQAKQEYDELLKKVNIRVDEKKIFNVIRKQDWFCENRKVTHDDIFNTVKTIAEARPFKIEEA